VNDGARDRRQGSNRPISTLPYAGVRGCIESLLVHTISNVKIGADDGATHR
jgi:hypothetical protein